MGSSIRWDTRCTDKLHETHIDNRERDRVQYTLNIFTFEKKNPRLK